MLTKVAAANFIRMLNAENDGAVDSDKYLNRQLQPGSRTSKLCCSLAIMLPRRSRGRARRQSRIVRRMAVLVTADKRVEGPQALSFPFIMPHSRGGLKSRGWRRLTGAARILLVPEGQQDVEHTDDQVCVVDDRHWTVSGRTRPAGGSHDLASA